MAKALRTLDWETIGISVLAVAFFVAGMWLLLWTEDVAAIITERYWVAETTVRYDETTTSRECDDEGNCRLVTETNKRTRCRSRETGYQLPIENPPPGCQMRRDDYLEHRQSCHISWRSVDEERTGRGSFVCSQWDSFEVGMVADLRLGIAGGLRSAQPVQGR